MKIIIVLCFYTFLSSGNCDEEPPLILEDRLRGGERARLGDIPHIVSLRGNNLHICGGSILNENNILTAAHCVHNYEKRPDLFTIQYGVLRITESFPNVVRINKIIKHEGYKDSGNYPNDIAILELEDDISFDEHVKPVVLPSPYSRPEDDSPVLLAGWGLNATGGHLTEDLHKVTLFAFREQICHVSDARYDADIHICAGIEGGGKGQCTGDSGGPLTQDGVQYGIVSWSKKPCGSPGHPGYFTKVAHYRNWIYMHTGL